MKAFVSKTFICCVFTVTCVLMCSSMSFSSSKPKLKKGMTLSQARKALLAAGWKLPKFNSSCFTPEGKRRVGDDDIYSCAGRKDDFLHEFVEYNGVAGSSATFYGKYRNSYGKCLELGYLVGEASAAGGNTSDLINSMRLIMWDPAPQECSPY